MQNYHTVNRMCINHSHSQFKARGFSLIETVLAIGVVSFAMLGILGMIPLGLNNFRTAMTYTAESEIVQNLSNQVYREDYATLDSSTVSKYYDLQGNYLEDGGTDKSWVFKADVAVSNFTQDKIPGGGDPNSVMAKAVTISVLNRTTNSTSLYSLIVNKG